MAANVTVMPSPQFRRELGRRGGETAARCYQCATCSSVCELAPDDAPFPRTQMLWAQWGLVDRVAASPSLWLCHQCNDCNIRCPRDAQPGDVMQTLRSLAVERLAFPGFLGRLCANVGKTWPLLVGLPLLLWIILLAAFGGHGAHLIPPVDASLGALDGRFYYEHFVPHVLIYVVYTLTVLWVSIAALVGASRLWKLMGGVQQRAGSFLGGLWSVIVEIATHGRFGTCGEVNAKRRWGHFLVFWGFVGAAVTSGLLILYLYRDTPPFSYVPLVMAHDYPLPLLHPVKWLGNISALALVVGGALLYLNRLSTDRRVGAMTAFDRFFLWTVLAVIITGVLTETLRFIAVAPVVACSMYLLHLSIVLTLFFTFPYSKFAHLVYRTVAMVHQKAVEKV